MIDRTNYDKIAIPENLDAVVGQAIDEGLSKRRRRTWGVWKRRAPSPPYWSCAQSQP